MLLKLILTFKYILDVGGHSIFSKNPSCTRTSLISTNVNRCNNDFVIAIVLSLINFLINRLLTSYFIDKLNELNHFWLHYIIDAAFISVLFR